MGFFDALYGKKHSALPSAPTGQRHSGPGTDRLCHGECLRTGQFLKSQDGHWMAVMQSDGNLAVNHNGKGVWGTGSNGKGGFLFCMQTDGNLVVYDHSNHALWASNTAGHPGAHVVMQNDGNLVVYAKPNHQEPLWSRNDRHGGFDLGRGLAFVATGGAIPPAATFTGEFDNSLYAVPHGTPIPYPKRPPVKRSKVHGSKTR